MFQLMADVFGRGRKQQAATATFDLDVVKSRSLDSFGTPVFIMKNGVIVFANQACCKAFGLDSPSQIVGDHIFDRLSDVQPDGIAKRQSLDAFNTRFHKNGFVRRTWSIKRLDGSASIVRSTVAKIPHEDFRCSVSIFDDMQAFAAEHAVQQSAVRALSENGTVKTVADCVTGTATALRDGARSLNGSCSKAATMLQEALGSTRNATENTVSISKSAREMSTATDILSVRTAERERQLLEASRKSLNISETLGQLSAAMSRIGDVTRLMTAFAGQTQLLALNATIEAARAGEAGRGFAVVAAEVKNLAKQSEQASESVRQQLSAIREMTGQAVSAGEEIAANFSCLIEEMSAFASDLDRQRASTHDIDGHAKRTADATIALHRIVDGLSDLVDENSVMSTSVLVNSTRLKSDADSLQKQVQDYAAALA